VILDQIWNGAIRCIEVCYGSFASFSAWAGHVRSTPNGHRQAASSRLKGARSGRRAGLRRRPARCSSHLEIRLCGSLDKSKLCQGRHTIVEADLLDNLAVLELQDGRTGELHLAPRVGGQ
jgi:hypothetical protein